MRIIDVNTKLVGLLGLPLGQSFSPALHNAIYSQLGLNWFYLPIEVQQTQDLAALVPGLRLMNFGGLAVTKPYKIAILDYLDQVDDSVRQIGSCNTIKVEDGRWIGYNTDGVGALRSLALEGGLDVAGKRYLSFGAGGAARALGFELARAGAAALVLTDVTDACFQLAEDINRWYPGLATAVAADSPQLEAEVGRAEVLLNLSGLGMAPHQDETPINSHWLRPDQFCFDATYNPEQTRFLQEAAARGCSTLNGLGMLLYQGTRQIALWTGVEEPVELMRQAAKNIL